MAITRQQANAATGVACRRMAAAYYHSMPIVTNAVIRALISEAKLVGTPAARKAVKAILREIYMDIFTEEPTGKRHFIHWVRSALSPASPSRIGVPDEPYNNVSLDDAFEAELEEIT